MDEKIRLHIGSGKCYLKGWVNLDIASGGAALASDNPAALERWATTEDAYYSRQGVQSIAEIQKYNPANDPPPVCDCYGSWWNMPFDDGAVQEVLSRQVFEHLSKRESEFALMEVRRVLCVGGLLRLDVPDHDEALKQLADARAIMATTNDPHIKELASQSAAFIMRHMLGSRRAGWAFHMGSWTREQLIRFVEDYGFELIGEEENIHPYPAFCLQFRKLEACVKYPWLDQPVRQWKAAWEYCGDPLGTPLTVPDNWNVLEIGPGRGRWPRANVYVDSNATNLTRIQDEYRATPGVNWPECHVTSVEELNPNWDGRFDFAIASHVLEHVPNPVKAAAELSRVARAGCVICPSEGKDALFLYHELDHKWHVKKWRDELHFYKIPEGRYQQFYDADLTGETHRLWRYGERRLEGFCDKARRWFNANEPYLDVVHHWGPQTGGLKVKVFD